MSGLQLPPFRLKHAAYVTSNLEYGQRRLSAMFGMSDFTVYPEIGIAVPGGEAKITFALITVNGTDLEVIQPLGGKDDVYRQAVPRDPTDIAFHHFASVIHSKDEWQMVLDAAENYAFAVPVHGDAAEGPRYIYLDTRAQLGHMLEYIWSP
jgi:hypothetical protein